MNKPVAWARQDGVIAFHKQKEVDSQGYKWFPLYTHPVKELTDEEILSVFVENYGDDILPNIQASGIDFARAILRKAQDGH
jgi:hypothetical protein